MKYTEIKKGPHKGRWENEEGVIYDADVAKTRMETPAAYDAPVVEKSAPKKKSAKK